MARWLSDRLEFHERETGPHSLRVQELADGIGARLGIPDHDRRGLRIAAALHDIGKIAVPTGVLRKSGPLDPGERALVERHSEAGWLLLQGAGFPWPIAELVHMHHERLDGSGYPRGLAGADIPMLARIVAVADSADAIMSRRPYDPARGAKAAVSELGRYAGTLYDRDAVRACIGVLEAAPVPDRR